MQNRSQDSAKLSQAPCHKQIILCKGRTEKWEVIVEVFPLSLVLCSNAGCFSAAAQGSGTNCIFFSSVEAFLYKIAENRSRVAREKQLDSLDRWK